MRKRIFPLHLACAAVLAVSSLHPVYAAAVQQENAEEASTADEAAEVTEPADEQETEQEAEPVQTESDEESAESITTVTEEEEIPEDPETEQTQTPSESEETPAEEEIPTDAAGNMISQETADAIENADMGADQITENPDEQQAEAVAESADTTLTDPQENAEPAMDKSSISAVFDDTYSFEKEDTKVYVVSAAAVKDKPADDADDIGQLEKYEEIRLTGTNSHKYWEVSYKGEIAYIDSALITRDYAVIEELIAEDERRSRTEAESKAEQEAQIAEKTEESRFEWATALADSRKAKLADQTRNPNWGGAVLSRSKGSVYGPSGKETYYNLNMSGCISNMNRRGYYGEVWVRNDGCKMFGDYIMCAANLGNHPYGSLVECSLGTCIVVDTGGFAAGNPDQLDIAVTW